MKLLLKATRNTNESKGTCTDVELYKRDDDTYLWLEIDECHHAEASQFPSGYEPDEFFNAFMLLDHVSYISTDFMKEAYHGLADLNDFYNFLKKFDLFGKLC